MIQKNWKRMVNMCVCFSLVLKGAVANGIAALTSNIEHTKSRTNSNEQLQTAYSFNQSETSFGSDKPIRMNILDRILSGVRMIAMSSSLKKAGDLRTLGQTLSTWKMKTHEYNYDQTRMKATAASRIRKFYYGVRDPTISMNVTERLMSTGRSPPYY
ncbi:hypothetical protein ACFFHM_14885 [Halalkalibacter kiskunsagensis]|uniref:Uncharacterized protein n=1 Tax=Halalkalibacter kiskunsagensis TaxID=1548599 RepID=A0ABV6KFN8_9BACI